MCVCVGVCVCIDIDILNLQGWISHIYMMEFHVLIYRTFGKEIMYLYRIESYHYFDLLTFRLVIVLFIGYI